ncbi:hypothetical protein M409DRAFT_22183 [Zasmidium cellare ATCC 36951]|uniref:F-box domain-containing protein n=1 Tax=Zasmidium cellare ATCC 36951 TaxID=1080233 RepID=A0A6A6CN76_ZASCE|nr:uncharacterized protein M409DRAFT_22183 [Zasmidium cellare ATCC 36951]KAF2167372.1 hypothetical protein M409DRAFT_22183 [Zasmidium cellare ATCC 36951]
MPTDKAKVLEKDDMIMRMIKKPARTLVYETTELLELIIGHLPPLDIMSGKRISNRIESVINTNAIKDKINFRDVLTPACCVAINPVIFGKARTSSGQSCGPPSGLAWFDDTLKIEKNILSGTMHRRPIHANSAFRKMAICSRIREYTSIKFVMETITTATVLAVMDFSYGWGVGSVITVEDILEKVGYIERMQVPLGDLGTLELKGKVEINFGPDMVVYMEGRKEGLRYEEVCASVFAEGQCSALKHPMRRTCTGSLHLETKGRRAEGKSPV